jgi:dihydroflavonol-4-reductase
MAASTQPQRVLVTGATGFVGKAIVRVLRERGHSVVGLVRDPNRAGALAQGAEIAVGDMLAPQTYRPLVANVDAVIMAAQYATKGRLTRERLAQVGRADAVMADALAHECLAHGKRFLYTSGCFNYGDHGADWITESTPFAPSPLGVAHARGVEMLRSLHATSGLDAVMLAPGFVYGPGGLFTQAFTDQLAKRRLRVIGSGQNYWSPIHVDDLAMSFGLALERAPAGAEYTVVDDAPLTLRSLVDQLTAALGHKRVGNSPAWLMKPLIGGPLVDSLVTSFRVRNDRAKAELGWSPRYPSCAEGLPVALRELGLLA